MSIKSWANKTFSKTTPPKRRKDDPEVIAKKEAADREEKEAAAIDAEFRTLKTEKLTPGLTPDGTQPARPPSDEHARVIAEKRVAAKDKKEAGDGAGIVAVEKSTPMLDQVMDAAEPGHGGAEPPRDPYEPTDTPEYNAHIRRLTDINNAELDAHRAARDAAFEHEATDEHDPGHGL